MVMRLSKLPEPPIKEVVCGILFDSIPSLDPVTLGGYWLEKKNEYPRHEFKQPIVSLPEGVEFPVGTELGPIRTWLISKRDDFIVQVQHDRFYLNWRARGAEYPRFNDWQEPGSAGPARGILSRFMEEVGQFGEFCDNQLGAPLMLRGVELAKIDHLERGRHWSSPADLSVVVPMLKGALDLSESSPTVNIRIAAPKGDGSLDLAIDTAQTVAQPPVPVLKLEFRRVVRRALAIGELQTTFQQANEDLNGLFGRLIPAEQHHRFEKAWRPL